MPFFNKNTTVVIAFLQAELTGMIGGFLNAAKTAALPLPPYTHSEQETILVSVGVEIARQMATNINIFLLPRRRSF